MHSLRIPFEKSKELAVKYGVYDQLAPMFDFNLDNMANQAGEESLLTKEQAMVARKKQALEAINVGYYTHIYISHIY